MIKRIATRSWSTIYRCSETSFLVIRQGRAVLLERTMHREFEQTAVSEHLSNMSCAAWTTDKKFFLFSNTSGKCIICDATTFAMQDAFYLRHEPHGHHFIGLQNEFLFLDRNGMLNCYDCNTKEVSYVLDQNNIMAIKLWNDKIHIFKNDTYYPINRTKTISSRRMKSVSLPIQIHDLPKSFLAGIWNRKTKDRYDNYIVAVNHVLVGEDYKPILSVLKNDSNLWEPILYLDRIESSRDRGYFCGCDIDFKRNLMAVVCSRAVFVIDIKTMNVLHEEPILYGSDICWVDNNSLLVAAWSGLYLMTIE